MKIAIIGIGGIGGLIGGALAKNNDDIYLIARGENLKAIRENGLKLKSDKLGEFIVHPKLVTDNPKEIGIVDVLFISTKSYGFESACKQCDEIVDKNTIVVPLLNGVSVSDEAKKYLSKGQIADGCIYGFSSLESQGVVRHIGDLCSIDFGFKDGRENKKCNELAEILNKSGIKTTFCMDILVPVWTKYIMMCGNSSVFSYFECSADIVQADSVKMKFIEDVYTELFTLAKKKGVALPDDLVSKHIEVFMRLPKGAITSLYRDLQNSDKKTEFEAIIGKGYHLAKEINLESPCLLAAYNKNKGR